MKLEKFKEKNSKKTGIIVFTIASILLLAVVFFFTSFASYVDIKSFNIISGNIPNIGDALYVYHLEDGRITTITPDFTGMRIDTNNTTCTYNATVSLVNSTIVLDKTNATNTSSQKIRCDIYLNGGFPVRAVDYMLELASNNELKQFGYDASTNSYINDEWVSATNDETIWVDYNNSVPELTSNSYRRCANDLNINTLYNNAEYSSFSDCMDAKYNESYHGRCVENPTTHKYYIEMNGCYQSYSSMSDCQTDLPSGMTCEYMPNYYGGYFIIGMDNNSVRIGRDFDNDFSEPNEMNWDYDDYNPYNNLGYLLKYNTFITSGSGTATDPFHLELRPDAPDGTYYSYGNFPETYGYQSVNDLKLHASMDNPYSDDNNNYYNIVAKTIYQNNTATSYEICLDNNTTVECFKPELTQTEVSKMETFFGSSNCDNYYPDSIDCNYTNGDLYLYCSLYDDYLSCGGRDVNCIIEQGELTCEKN